MAPLNVLAVQLDQLPGGEPNLANFAQDELTGSSHKARTAWLLSTRFSCGPC